MKEPERLFSTDPDLVALHEVLDRDAPPPGAIERAAGRILAESTSDSGPRNTGATHIRPSKPWIVVGIGVTVLVAGAIARSPWSQAPGTDRAPVTSIEAVLAPAPSASVAHQATSPSAAEDPPAEPSVHVDDLPAATRPTAPPSPARSADPLVDELAFVERARAALAQGRGRECLDATRGYETRFAKGGLFREEIGVMHIEALAMSGDRGAAHTLGQRFLEAHPGTPYIERIRRVLDQAAVQKPPSGP